MSADKLKFRVWDTENECYQERDADETFIRHNGTLMCVFWGDCDTMPTEYVEQEKAVIEFCTGLKDHNGNLVFEGDIIAWGDLCLSEVLWDDEQARFVMKQYSYNEKGEYTGTGVLESLFERTISFSEIVGHIHKGILKR